ncbi:hypothetical protein ACH5RR_024341 [Cinchona calisaya]|uniref:Myb-related protein 123 n=1 Tax=Cinchona calisaya TaxID=153742 RepID=A0ABD2YXK9_9GENT
MGRSPCCAKEGLNRGAWTSSEDRILRDYIKSNGEGKWGSLPKRAGLKRCGKSCRLRWLNYLRPDIKRGNITVDEEDLIIRLHKLLGNRWSLIAGRLPGRTDNEIKNYWNTNLSKKIQGAKVSSSTKCKPSSSTKSRSLTVVQKNLTSDNRPNGPLNSDVGSCVVRTKATRCNKVFINADLQSTQQLGIMVPKTTSPSSADRKHDDFIMATSANDKNVLPEPPTFPSEEGDGGIGYSSSGCMMMDFEMDDKFFSDFLNADFAAFENHFDKEVAQQTTNTTAETNDRLVSPNSCENAVLHDHSDLGSMASLLDPATMMDWLHEDK